MMQTDSADFKGPASDQERHFRLSVGPVIDWKHIKERCSILEVAVGVAGVDLFSLYFDVKPLWFAVTILGFGVSVEISPEKKRRAK